MEAPMLLKSVSSDDMPEGELRRVFRRGDASDIRGTLLIRYSTPLTNLHRTN
jgi:hypothetical protein